MNILKAYDTLNKTGAWPLEFIPEYVMQEATWCVGLAMILANEFVKNKLKKKLDRDV